MVTHYEELSAGPFTHLRTALLHGRMTESAEKEAVMKAFKAGEIDVLFSTTVIEVGIDVAAATTMIIEDAAQFGLTQLHQLRGRVGRGSEESFCFLLGESKTDDGKRRLEVFCATTNGVRNRRGGSEAARPGRVPRRAPGPASAICAWRTSCATCASSISRDATRSAYWMRIPASPTQNTRGLADAARRVRDTMA